MLSPIFCVFSDFLQLSRVDFMSWSIDFYVPFDFDV